MYKRFIVLVLLTIFIFPVFAQEKPYVVVISLDGFRWDYVDKYDAKNLRKFAGNGVHAKALIPSFPSLTFPNHFSLATGLYPDHHGIVNNSFYDPDLKRSYRIGDRKAVEDNIFYGGEPIWVTAENQGIKSASFFWVGSETDVKGGRPTYWKRYEHEFPFSQRIDTLIAWLSKPEELRPHLVMGYFHDPDETSHAYGPNSEETGRCVRYLDSLMGVLIFKISQLPIANQINLIILSDHGMTDVSPEKEIYVLNYLKKEWISQYGGYGAISNLFVQPEYIDSVLLALKDVPHLTVWKNKDIPARYHYGTNRRCGDLTLLARDGWSLNFKSSKLKYIGAHGYDNQDPDMHAIFYASGPAFAKNKQVPAFENVEVYGILCKILGLKPAPYDGKAENLKIFQ